MSVSERSNFQGDADYNVFFLAYLKSVQKIGEHVQLFFFSHSTFQKACAKVVLENCPFVMSQRSLIALPG